MERMQSELGCATRHFLWSSVLGSAFGEGGDVDAFATAMFALQHKLDTYVRKGAATTAKIHSACGAPERMGCFRVHTPVCKWPCKKRRDAAANHETWAAGGAVCRGKNVTGNMCEDEG